MIPPRPHRDNEEMRPVRMLAVADFLGTQQLSEFERAQVAKCLRLQTSASEDDLNGVADPYYRGELLQLVELLEDMNLDAQGHYDVRKARDVGLGPFGSPKMHRGFLLAGCRRLKIALRPFDSRRVERPKPKIYENAGR